MLRMHTLGRPINILNGFVFVWKIKYSLFCLPHNPVYNGRVVFVSNKFREYIRFDFTSSQTPKYYIYGANYNKTKQSAT